MAYFVKDNLLTGILYNLSGRSVPAGITEVIKIVGKKDAIEWGEVFGSDKEGKYVTILKEGSLLPEVNQTSLVVFPNPSDESVQIGLYLPVSVKTTFRIYDVMGKAVYSSEESNLPAGRNFLDWNGKDQNGNYLSPGIYILRLEALSGNKKIFYGDSRIIRMQ